MDFDLFGSLCTSPYTVDSRLDHDELGRRSPLLEGGGGPLRTAERPARPRGRRRGALRRRVGAVLHDSPRGRRGEADGPRAPRAPQGERSAAAEVRRLPSASRAGPPRDTGRRRRPRTRSRSVRGWGRRCAARVTRPAKKRRPSKVNWNPLAKKKMARDANKAQKKVERGQSGRCPGTQARDAAGAAVTHPEEMRSPKILPRQSLPRKPRKLKKYPVSDSSGCSITANGSGSSSVWRGN